MGVASEQQGWLRTLSRAELLLAGVAFVLLLACSLCIILLRGFFAGAWSVRTVEVLSQFPPHLMLVSALLGGSLALSRGSVLRIEALNSFLPSKAQKPVGRSVALFALLLYCGFLFLVLRYLTVDFRAVVAFLYLPLFVLLGVKLAILAIRPL
ncbi:MAG: hypothetical protein NZL89_04845 [Leptospiraceae bacterium]|nr:hypothetical protein [Leptospiraceae bacterium]